MMLGARTAAMSGKGLPYDAKVEYLQQGTYTYSSGCCIDLGFCPSSKDGNILTIEASFQGDATWGCLYGAVSGETAPSVQNYLYYQLNKTSNTDQFRLITYSGDLFYTKSDYSVKSEYRVVANKLYIDGKLVLTGNGNGDIYKNLFLFARSQANGTCDQFGNWRIYSCKYSRSGAYLVDMIPVRVGSVGYMYDRVSKTLFGNAGTGAFIIGPDVSAANGGGISANA